MDLKFEYQMRHVRLVESGKKYNGDEWGKECHLNCQTESKLSAADIYQLILILILKKIFFRERYGIIQINLNFFFIKTQ